PPRDNIVSVGFECQLSGKAFDCDQPEAFCQRGALGPVRLDGERSGGQLACIDHAGELRRGSAGSGCHQNSPLRPSLVPAAHIRWYNCPIRIAIMAGSAFSLSVILRITASVRLPPLRSPSPSRYAPSRPPSVPISLVMCLPTTRSPMPLSRSCPSMSLTNNS